MKIAIGSDHIGYPLKLHIAGYLTKKGHFCRDYGAFGEERVDYPVYAKAVADAVVSGENEVGILICGTGIGISIAANKIKGIRAVACSEPYSAMLARQHNNANILAFGSRVIGTATAEMITDMFLSAEYEAGRHQKRLDMIAEMENG